MKKKLFTSHMKLADLLTENHNLILMLPRFGIPLGFGERSVAEVCAKHNVSADFMLMVCNTYTFDDFLPTTSDIAHTDMGMLIPYLQASHHYYMHNRIPHIRKHLLQIADKIEARIGELLVSFFNNYAEEIQEHFHFEEQEVFRYLTRLETEGERHNEVTKQVGVRFQESHGSIEDKLSDLIQIIYKYLPGDAVVDESIELVFDIMQLSADLEKHECIEEKILLPYMKWLERR